MTKYRTLFMTGACLLSSYLPSFAITGCTNSYLSGTYNAQVSSAAFNSVISTLNANAGLTLALKPASTASNGATTAGGGSYGGLVGNGASLSGNVPSLGRYYFDGNGAIVGLANYVPPIRAQVGSYSVNNDCTLSIKLNTGQTYGGVVVAQGQQVLFIESDAAAPGTTGTLSRSINNCSAPTSQQSFGFTYYGASAVDASMTTGGISTATSGTLLTFQPFSAVGSITLDGAGGFTMNAFSTTVSGIQMQASSGTYTTAADCSLNLKFNANTTSTGGTTGAFVAPLGFSGLLSDNGNGGAGVLSVQNWQGGTATGMVIPQ